MPFNVLLLPLLGGYVFITNWNRTRFQAKRYTGERLLLHAAFAGVVLLSLSFVLVHVLLRSAPSAQSTWRDVVPFDYSGTSFGAFLLGSTLWWPLNLVSPVGGEVRRTISRWGDFLEILLDDAMRNTKQVSISIDSGKVYIGFVTGNFDPSYDRKYIRLLPMSSGYRHANDHKVVLNTDYARVYQQMIQQDNAFLLNGAEQFEIVIPVTAIVSANLFDPDAYDKFQSQQLG
jgi:hypothetical protein